MAVDKRQHAAMMRVLELQSMKLRVSAEEWNVAFPGLRRLVVSCLAGDVFFQSLPMTMADLVELKTRIRPTFEAQAKTAKAGFVPKFDTYEV
jgi:hypothetical protein